MSKVILRKYGESAIFNFDLFEIDGVDFKTDAVYVAGDVKLMKDEGAETNVSSGFVDEGQGYSQPLNTTEMEFARGRLYIVDQGTKAWLDTGLIIETYGHASAQHEVFPSDIKQISGDSTAADNLESQFDETGLTGGTFPGRQDQLAGLANVGSAINRPAASYNLTTGTQSANTFASTEALDGIRHEHTDDAGALDIYYEFNIGAGFASSVQVTGYVQGVNDDVDVYGYDWVAAAWVQIGNIDGSALANDQVNSFDMFVDMVGSGANQGIVRVRFYKASGLTSATLAIDQIFTAFNQTAEGYQNAAIWFDSNASNTNTVKGIDGTATNPVSTMAAVNTLLASTNLSRVEIISGSTVTLAASQNNQVINGDNWTLELGGRDISGSSFIGAHVSGIASGTGTEQTFRSCHLDACTHIKETHFIECGIRGTQTAGEAGDYYFDRPHSAIAGTNTWIWDFGTAVGNTNLNWRNGSGGIQLESMGDTGIDTASIEGRGQIIEGTCTGGIVAVRGSFTDSGITNLTLVDGARYESDTLIKLLLNELITSQNYNIKNSLGRTIRELKENPQYEGGHIYFDSIDGAAGDEAFINGTLDNPVNNEADLLTLKAALNIHSVKIRPGSTLTLSEAHEKQEYRGEGWTLNLAGQSISASFFHGATSVNGIGTGAVPPKFCDCTINNVTLPPSSFHKCGFAGIFTVGSAGDFFFVGDSHSAVAGVGTPSFSYGIAIGVTNFNFRGYHGGQNVKDMTTGDNLSFDGDGQIIIDSSSGPGIMRIAGHQKMTGAEEFIEAGGTIEDSARFATDQFPVTACIGGGGSSTPSYAEEGEPECIVQGDVVNIPRYIIGDQSAKTMFHGVKAASGDESYIIGVIQCTVGDYDADTNKTAYLIPYTENDTKTVAPNTYKAETEVRDANGVSNPVTGDRFDLNVIGKIIT